MIPLINHESIYVSVIKILRFCWDQVHPDVLILHVLKKKTPNHNFWPRQYREHTSEIPMFTSENPV